MTAQATYETERRAFLADRASRLQAALDHLHEIDGLDGDGLDHEMAARAAYLRRSLTAARDATARAARRAE